MSKTQEILKSLAGALHNGTIGEDMCLGLIAALNGVPEEFHMAAFKAMLEEENLC